MLPLTPELEDALEHIYARMHASIELAPRHEGAQWLPPGRESAPRRLSSPAPRAERQIAQR